MILSILQRLTLRLFAVAWFQSALMNVHVFAQPLLDNSYSPAYLQSPKFVGDGKHLCCSHAEAALQKYRMNAAIQSFSTVRRPYHVLSYSLMLDWTNPLSSIGESGSDRRFWGSNTIRMRVDSANVSSITLNAATLVIDSIIVTGKRLASTVSYDTQNQEIRFALPTPAKQGDTLVVTLYYTHTSATNNDGGFFLYRKGRYGGLKNKTDSAFVAERLAYTMGEPNDARRWMPCNDVPYDKALMDIAIRVPNGFTALSNGLLERTEVIRATNTTTYFWRHSSPIPTYLMVALASVYQKRTEWYKRVNNPRDSVEIQNYFWAVDDTTSITDGTQYNASRLFTTIKPTLEAYSRWYGEYPFEKLGTAAIQPFQYGGMEHQTMITYNRSWLKGNLQGMVHEMMHHWTGDKVTCGTWADIWLNEGGASHGEALWYESWGGASWYKDAMKNFRNGYLTSKANTNPIYIPNTDDPNLLFNYATTYAKGAWVYHMVRRMIAATAGDSAYFRAIRYHLNRFAYSSAVTDDFRTSLEQSVPNSPVSFTTFMNQWIYQAGHPFYDVDWRSEPFGADQSVSVTLRQLQSGANVPQVFVMPVNLTFVGAQGQRSMQRLVNTQREQQERFTLPFVPVRVIVDENEDILCERTNRASALQPTDSATTFALKAYPQPLPSGSALTIELSVPTDGAVNLTITDVLGRQQTSVYQGFLNKGVYYLPYKEVLAAGTYFVRATGGGATAVQKIMVTR